jgi:hypothetical protein
MEPFPMGIAFSTAGDAGVSITLKKCQSKLLLKDEVLCRMLSKWHQLQSETIPISLEASLKRNNRCRQLTAIQHGDILASSRI